MSRFKFSRQDHEEEAFHNAIVEEPDNDTIRKIYADWLRENGNPNLGDLIHRDADSIHSANRYLTPNYEDFHDNYRSIFGKHFGNYILGELGDRWRGFLEQSGNKGFFERHHGAVRSVIPLIHKDREVLPLNIHMIEKFDDPDEAHDIAEGLAEKYHELVTVADGRKVLVPPGIDRTNINKIIAEEPPVVPRSLSERLRNPRDTPEANKVRRVQEEIERQQRLQNQNG